MNHSIIHAQFTYLAISLHNLNRVLFGLPRGLEPAADDACVDTIHMQKVSSEDALDGADCSTFLTDVVGKHPSFKR